MSAPVTTIGYDHLGRTISVTDPNNHATNYSYNSLNQLVSKTDALGNITSYTLDALYVTTAGDIAAVEDYTQSDSNKGVIITLDSGNDGSQLWTHNVVPSADQGGYTYADNNVKGDPALNENFAIPDMPAGYYTVFIKQSYTGAFLFRTVVYVRPGHITWLDIFVNPPSGN